MAKPPKKKPARDERRTIIKFGVPAWRKEEAEELATEDGVALGPFARDCLYREIDRRKAAAAVHGQRRNVFISGAAADLDGEWPSPPRAIQDRFFQELVKHFEQSMRSLQSETLTRLNHLEQLVLQHAEK